MPSKRSFVRIRGIKEMLHNYEPAGITWLPHPARIFVVVFIFRLCLLRLTGFKFAEFIARFDAINLETSLKAHTRERTTSVGIDIEEVKRFRSLARNRTFLNSVFDEGEISYCKSKGNNTQSLAGIFAAKEAVIKALSQFATVRYSVSDFSIYHNKKGAPLVKESRRRNIHRLPRGVVISLSIAHTSSQALAVAIAQKG